ncbi:MAG: DUF4091 domain-containing protein [Thermoguttaceae bacterium]|nr:DUF4091 domain-containing protein [Thermoguttaceae bacterium]
MKRRKIGFVGAVAAALFGVAGLAASVNWAISAISANFAFAGDVFKAAQTVEQPTEWTLSVDGAGERKDGVFELKGGDNSASWRSNPVAFEAGKVYRFRFKASVVPGGGSGASAPSGASFAHYDFTDFPKKETPEDYYSFVFVAPKGVKEAQLRLGQWDSHRDYRFAEPTLTAVQPAYQILEARTKKQRRFGDPKEVLALGAGESISDGVYRFSTFRASEPTNFDRPLVSTTSNFNTNRWTLGNDAEVVYRFALEPKTCDLEMHADAFPGSENSGKIVKTRKIPFVSGKISMNIGHSTAGRAVLEGSLDGKNWAALGEIAGTGSVEATLEKLLDGKAADEIFVRVRGEAGEDGKWCNSQVYNLSAELTLNPTDAPLFSGLGETYFADYIDGADYLLGEDKRDKFQKRGNGQGNASAQTWTLWGLNEGNCWTLSGDRYRETSLRLLLQDEKSPLFGENGGAPECERRYVVGGARPVVVGTRFFPYFVQNFTREISGLTGKTDKVSLSWCEQDYRIPKNAKETKIGAAEPIRIYAAKNDFESFQVAVRALGGGIDFLSGAVVGDLTGPNGATISAENVDLRYAYYHYVANPTDKTCAVGWYPDALVPLEAGSDGLGAPLGVEVGENLPIWTTVRVPADAASGTYRGAIRLTGSVIGEFDATIPFEVVVWDFALPAKNTLETAYGMSPGNVWRYHNCKTEEDKRAVFEKYLKIFGDYRISPYNPAPLDGIGVKWLPEENPPRCELDFSRFEKEMTRVFAQYNFTNFRLPFEGLGWGTYAESAEGEIAGYAGDTPQYKAMIADYGKKLQEGLRERGLLDAAYVYWFDEPEPKDYGFVARGFGKLKKYAPEIDRMLTEEPSPEFRKILEENDASIDVWCPVSPAYDEAQGKIEKDAGNRFWWYVCTYPKEPYCTEFTDHPPVELRIWHWQTFERGITGCLVWESTYWTSSAAFPNEAQNPYLDPMCYVSGYSTPAGTKQFWGNGDGRFIYPPLSAATPGRNDGKPIFDDPVASVRWEMIREGVQDYEMLSMLKKLTENRDLTDAQRKKVEEIFDFSPITTDMTTFSTDPKPLLEKRRAVAEAIVELSE